MTSASQLALTHLRDLSTLKWNVIPFLSIVFYIYAREIKKARSSGNWDAVYAGLTLFGMDFVNETWNGWVLHFTQRSACWTAPEKPRFKPWWGGILKSCSCSPSQASSITTPCQQTRRKESWESPTGGSGPSPIRHSAYLLMRPQYGGAAGLGISLVEPKLFRHLADLLFRLFPLLRGHHICALAQKPQSQNLRHSVSLYYPFNRQHRLFRAVGMDLLKGKRFGFGCRVIVQAP